MPQIEVLPNKSSAPAPGWAYVADTGFDPSKAPIQPSGPRQRAARQVGALGAGEGSVRQNNAILKHLADLDKDNHRDVHIPVPVRQRDGAGRASRGKVTTNVRRILSSQKTLANYLADEEALMASAPSHAVIKVAKAPATRAKRPSLGQGNSAGKAKAKAKQPPAASGQADEGSASSPRHELPGAAADDEDPLLQSMIPPLPSLAELDELMCLPARSYATARAAPSASTLPPRRFCEICGYWGRIKCVKCGARVCGLECKGMHDEGRCLKFYV